MEKITLAGKEYVLPELNFGAMRKLGKLGFNLSDASNADEKLLDFLASTVAFVTNSTLEEADGIIDNSFSNAEEFTVLITKLSNWIVNSDFFKKMQVESKKK